MFPNPASDLVTIEWEGLKPDQFGQAMIFGVTGHEVYRQDLMMDEGKAILNVETMPPGVYWCKLSLDGLIVFSEKVVLIK
jgi:hypothetical protein